MAGEVSQLQGRERNLLFLCLFILLARDDQMAPTLAEVDLPFSPRTHTPISSRNTLTDTQK